MSNNGNLDQFPKVYCALCGRLARQSGPCQTTCPNDHVVTLFAIYTPYDPAPVAVSGGMPTWHDLPPLL